MIRLIGDSGHSLKLTLDVGTASCCVNYSDETATGYSGGSQLWSASAGVSTICTIPAAAAVRDIDFINIANTHSAAISVTLHVNAGASNYELVDVNLAVDESLCYTHGSGWQAREANGAIKVSTSSGGSLPGTTDDLAEGGINLYFTEPRVRDTSLAGLPSVSGSGIVSTDTVLEAFAKAQAQMDEGFGSSTYTATSPIGGHRILTINLLGELTYASNDDVDSVGRILGMSANAASSGDPVKVTKFGNEVEEPSWSWTVGLPVYLGENGLLTQTVPESPAIFSLIVGFPLAPTLLFLTSREPIILGA